MSSMANMEYCTDRKREQLGLGFGMSTILCSADKKKSSVSGRKQTEEELSETKMYVYNARGGRAG